MRHTDFGALKTTHCPTFFILSTADFSQQASTFGLRAMGDVRSGFRLTEMELVLLERTLTPPGCWAPISGGGGGGVSETRAHRNIPWVNEPLKLIKQTIWGCSWACGRVVAAGDGFNSEEEQRYIMGPWLWRAPRWRNKRGSVERQTGTETCGGQNTHLSLGGGLNICTSQLHPHVLAHSELRNWMSFGFMIFNV